MKKNPKKKVKETYEDPLGGLLLILIFFTPSIPLYILLESSMDETTLFASMWALILTGFIWLVIYWVTDYVYRKKEAGNDTF